MTNSGHLFFSLDRMWTIGRNTMTEVIRQKFFYILLLFGIVVLCTAIYFSQITISTPAEQVKFIKDFGLAAIMVFGSLIAIVGTAQLLPLELDNRTIYPILAKPVHRAEFLLGKFVGMAALLFLTVLLMSGIFAGLLFYAEHYFKQTTLSDPTVAVDASTRELVNMLVRQIRDVNLVKAVVLTYFKVVMVCAISLLISTFATSVIFNVIASFMIYVCGHLESTARQVWVGSQASWSKFMLPIITFFVPDLNAFNIADAVVNGQFVPMHYVYKTIGYGLFYTSAVLAAAYVIFQEKEI